MNYIYAVVIALDQLVNALIVGDPDEMISARAHRETSRCWAIAEQVIDKVFFWQQEHCKNAYLYERKVTEEKFKSY
jgi:hypothetical protein